VTDAGWRCNKFCIIIHFIGRLVFPKSDLEGAEMFNANANSHYKTLKGWTKSAEYSRNKLLEQVKEATAGMYSVKMGQSSNWQIMHRPPATGAAEWLYVNANGVPIYYWNKNQDGVTLI
jgi:hypothetical protein